MNAPVRQDGEAFGCTDGAPPEGVSEERLSRILDAVDACRVVGDEGANAFFRTLPDEVKMSFNYSKWRYVARKASR